MAYATANLRLIADGEHALATALIQSVLGDQVTAGTQRMHTEMSKPLRAALDDLGVPDAAASARLISTVVYTASRMIEGADLPSVDARVRELLASFLVAPARPAD